MAYKQKSGSPFQRNFGISPMKAEASETHKHEDHHDKKRKLGDVDPTDIFKTGDSGPKMKSPAKDYKSYNFAEHGYDMPKNVKQHNSRHDRNPNWEHDAKGETIKKEKKTDSGAKMKSPVKNTFPGNRGSGSAGEWERAHNKKHKDNPKWKHTKKEGGIGGVPMKSPAKSMHDQELSPSSTEAEKRLEGLYWEYGKTTDQEELDAIDKEIQSLEELVDKYKVEGREERGEELREPVDYIGEDIERRAEGIPMQSPTKHVRHKSGVVIPPHPDNDGNMSLQEGVVHNNDGHGRKSPVEHDIYKDKEFKKKPIEHVHTSKMKYNIPKEGKYGLTANIPGK